MNKLLLRIESLIILGGGIYIYFQSGYGWLLFALLIFAPDLSMIGYARNKEYGAVIYNLFHTYSVPLLLGALGYLLSKDGLSSVSIIWICHIAMDRLIGYGLKYNTGFKDTHLGRI